MCCNMTSALVPFHVTVQSHPPPYSFADLAEWPAMNDIYAPYFEKHRPVRSAVAVSGMAGDARVEIECMAVTGARNAS